MATRENPDRPEPAFDRANRHGHNRWHPDIPPVVECGPGDEVILETRDALDGQLTPETILAQVGVSQVVDVPHVLISAFLPLDIFG